MHLVYIYQLGFSDFSVHIRCLGFSYTLVHTPVVGFRGSLVHYKKVQEFQCALKWFQHMA